MVGEETLTANSVASPNRCSRLARIVLRDRGKEGPSYSLSQRSCQLFVVVKPKEQISAGRVHPASPGYADSILPGAYSISH